MESPTRPLNHSSSTMTIPPMRSCCSTNGTCRKLIWTRENYSTAEIARKRILASFTAGRPCHHHGSALQLGFLSRVLILPVWKGHILDSL